MASLLVVLAATIGWAVPVATAAGVPGCTYEDVLTTYRGNGDWMRSLLDTKYRLSSTYAPSDLVPISRANLSGGGSIRAIVIDDLAAMEQAARAAGARLAVQSAYRSYSTQVSTFNYWVRVSGYQQALLTSARPGHSEHQLGTTIDFRSYGGGAPWNVADWGATSAGSWLREHAWKYGFVISYPNGGSPGLTCYAYEPWHVRYVGRAIAGLVHDSRLTPREWLWNRGAISGWRFIPVVVSPKG
jgi:D-alanyl-D-alanine carboxypeptidase